MPSPDSTAKTALASFGFAPAYYFWLDILGDPLRVTTFGQTTTVSGSGDSELDGTYTAWGGQLIEVGDVTYSSNGSESLTVTLSGIVTMDTSLLNEIGDKTQWQGRLFRAWCRLYDPNGAVAQGAIFPLYTGYMSSVKLVTRPTEQVIQLTVENWRATFNQPSMRTYLMQKLYDATDTSAQATISAANGRRREAGGADDTPNIIPGGTNPNATPGFGWTGSGGYVSYTPYPDNQSVNYDNPSYIGTQKA